MTKVVCCQCRRAVYLKPGESDGDSHSFCQECLDEFCKENKLDPIEIIIPEGAIINYECFPEKKACGSS